MALVGVVLIATLAFSKCCYRAGWLNFSTLLLGLGFLWAPLFFGALSCYEAYFTPVGAVLVAWAHWRNFRSGCGLKVKAHRSEKE